MKFIYQFCIILLFSFIGEILSLLIPLPVPPGIYGIILLFLCLELKIVPLSAVKGTGSFLIDIMPVMFIPAAVGIIGSWDIIKQSLFKFAVVVLISTAAVMAVSGTVTQFIIRKSERQLKKHD
ncbi:MAG: CidA/LrgA family protein [Clostridium sp.]|nr:CidA/LrgA family protein [Clostridium sp.]MCM1546835.1 CidA/LrgA family protein [Ruminococcus sp.]